MSYPPHGGYQPPAPQRKTPIIVAFSIAGIALLVAIAAVIVVLVKNDSDSGDDQAAQQTTETVQQQAPQTQVQTETQTQTVTPPPNRGNDLQSALAAGGFNYPCPNSAVHRQRTGTTCEWARKVESQISSRGGGFTSVPIYSEGANTTIWTTCTDVGLFYQCTGRNSTIAVALK